MVFATLLPFLEAKNASQITNPFVPVLSQSDVADRICVVAYYCEFVCVCTTICLRFPCIVYVMYVCKFVCMFICGVCGLFLCIYVHT